MLRTLALALVFGTTVLFGSLYAYATDHDESTGNGIDLSGVGRCSGRTLNVTSAWSWTQYPSRPSVTEVTEVPDGFVGKNAIVWTGDGAFDEFVVQSIDDRVVSADRALEVNGSCHFTLDKSSGLPRWRGGRVRTCVWAVAQRSVILAALSRGVLQSGHLPWHCGKAA
jgi:hypothetical protein